MRYRWDPPYPMSGRRTAPHTDAGLRASDAERNQVAERLSYHYTEGRLDQVEFKARIDTAMSAVTRGDLDGLFDDLPPVTGDPPTPRPRHRRLVPIVFLTILVVLSAGWVMSLGHAPWVLIVLVGLLLWHRAGRRDSSRRARSELDR